MARWPRIVIVLTVLALGGCTGGRQAGRPVASAETEETAGRTLDKVRRTLR
jgi:hypothetical protein